MTTEEPSNDIHFMDDGYYEDVCFICHGEGFYYDCQDEIGCVDPEGGCDLCMRACDHCAVPTIDEGAT